MASPYVLSNDSPWNDVALRLGKIVEADEDVEQIFGCILFRLLVQHPGPSAPLIRLHLNPDAPRRIDVGRQDVDAPRVTQGE